MLNITLENRETSTIKLIIKRIGRWIKKQKKSSDIIKYGNTWLEIWEVYWRSRIWIIIEGSYGFIENNRLGRK